VLLGLGAGVWAYLHLKQTKKPTLNANAFIPKDCSYLFVSNNLDDLTDKLLRQNMLWKEMQSRRDVANLSKGLNFLDSLLDDSETREFIKDRMPVYMGLYKGGELILAMNLSDASHQKALLEACGHKLQDFKEADNYYSFKVPFNKSAWYLWADNGVLVLSSSETLIQKTLTLNENDALVHQPLYQELTQLNTDETSFKLYRFSAEAHKATAVSGMNGSVIADVYLQPDHISVSGFCRPDSLSVLNNLNGQEPQQPDFYDLLPASTKLFCAYGFNDFGKFRNNCFQRSFTEQERKTSAALWKRINDTSLYDAEKEFYQNVQSHLVHINQTMAGDSVEQMVLLLRLKDSVVCKEWLKLLADSTYLLPSEVPGRFTVFRLHPDFDLVKACLGPMFKMTFPYAAVYNNHLVLCNAPQTMQRFGQAVCQGHSLSQSTYFMRYAADNMAGGFNFLYYTSSAQHDTYITTLLPPDKVKGDTWKTMISDLSLSASNYKQHLQFRFQIQCKREENAGEKPYLWTFAADTAILTTPYVFKNHLTSEQEIVFQDAWHQLYLVNANGRQLWKRELQEPIRSTIYQVDAFRNKKLQMVFSTDHCIYMIDRNGKDVEGFPVKLPAKASNALTLLEYSGNRDYRLFIACEDKRIYNYTVEGKKYDGYTPLHTDAPVELPIQYVKVGLSDYLITVDREGKPYAFSRKGEGRVDFKHNLPQKLNALYIDAGSTPQATQLVALDQEKGSLVKLSLADKTQSIRLDESTDGASVSFDKVDDDKKTDMLVVARDALYVYDLNGNRIKLFREGQASFSECRFYEDLDRILFLLYDRQQARVFFLKADDEKIESSYAATQFPLIAGLFNDGKKYLLLPENNFLQCMVLP